jgi:peptidoglycan/LPS O-acetylase OafA/YrhL
VAALTKSRLVLLYAADLLNYGVPTGVTAMSAIGTIILSNAVAILFVFATFHVARLVLPSIGKTTLKLIKAIALLSYCVYLFHIPFFESFIEALSKVPYVNVTEVYIFGIALGVPLLFLRCHALQSQENSLILRLMEQRENHKRSTLR